MRGRLAQFLFILALMLTVSGDALNPLRHKVRLVFNRNSSELL